MDGDGDLDAVTARCINDGPITPINQTLLWIENNQNRPPNQLNPWHINEIKGIICLQNRNYGKISKIYILLNKLTVLTKNVSFHKR